MINRTCLLTLCLFAASAAAQKVKVDEVNVVNPELNVREVAPPGHEPYHTLFSIAVPTGLNSVGGHSPDPVPEDKRLVIEFVSVRVGVQPGQTPLFVLNDLLDEASLAYVLPLTSRGNTGSFDEYLVAQQIRLYHDGNGTNGPGAQCARSPAGMGTAFCSIAISGYLIDK